MAQEKGTGTYNAIIIGAGTAGLVTAAGTAGLGGRVALIERHKMGGDCLNFGCVPSKALISSARVINTIRNAEKWGLEKQDPQFEFRNIFESMRQRRAIIEPNDSRERFEELGVDVFEGDAKFISPHEIDVDGTRLKAKHFVIATGRRAGIPPIEGIEDVPYYTNETFFDNLNEKPNRLIVIGGGPIGCELGQTMHRFGVDVTMVEFMPQIFGKEDANVAGFMRERLEKEGLHILTSTGAKKAEYINNEIHLTVGPASGEGDDEIIKADALLIAAGRIPNVETLNLEAAGVKHDRGGVTVNEYLQTSQKHIYACGDIAGPYQFTHTADAQARVVVRNILMPLQLLRQKVDLSIVPWSTYTSPEVAHVGLTKAEANDKNIPYDLYTQELNEVDRAIVESETTGFAEVITEQGSDKILGVTIVSQHAGDLLHEFVLAMKHNIGLAGIAATIHAYPTFAELARKVGDQYNRTRLTPRAKSIFSWLYRKSRGTDKSSSSENGQNLSKAAML
ncbi:MAG: mercuric reductase [Candidatus Latescibacteria bacterium]|nr:mercuric reductase [Candidatus Latescibacterota bacterium]